MAGAREPVRLKGALVAAAPLVPVIGFVLAFGILPVALLLATALVAAGPPGLAAALVDPVNEFAVRNSVLQGAASAALAVLVGYPIGVFLGRYTWTGRSIVRAVLLVPFLLPSIVVAVAVQGLFGPGGWVGAPAPALRGLGRGIDGIVVVNVLFNAPLVALLTAVGVEASSGRLEDETTMLGAGPLRRYRDVWGPGSWVGAAAGALLTFVFSALAFAAPLLLCGARCYTVEARVWALDQVIGDPTTAALLAVGLLLIVLPPTIAYGLLLPRLRSAEGSERGPSRRSPWRSPAASACAVVTVGFLGFAALALGSVIGRSVSDPVGGWTGAGWTALFGTHVASVVGISTPRALANSLLFALASSGIAVLLGVLGGLAARRHTARGSRIATFAFLPVVVSPILLSFSLASTWRPVLGGESTVWLLILLAQATIALPFAVQSLLVPMRFLSTGPRDAAVVLGASPSSAFLDVDLPRLRTGLWTAALFAFALSLGEFTATFFLATPEFTTLPVELYRLEALRQLPAASALAALLVLVSAAALLSVSIGGQRVEL